MSSEFKPGDRVVRKDSGEFGTVSASPPPDRFWDLYVTMDNLGTELGFYEHELVLFTENIETDKADLVNRPAHYKSATGLEVIDVIEAFDLDRYLANVVKYVLRSPSKGNEVEDLKKAVWYLQRKIDRLENS